MDVCGLRLPSMKITNFDLILTDLLNKLLLFPLEMTSKNVTLRVLAKKMADLRLQRLISFHLLHPDLGDEYIHCSRSVFSFLLEWELLNWWRTCIIVINWWNIWNQKCVFHAENLGQAENLMLSMKSAEHLKFQKRKCTMYCTFLCLCFHTLMRV